jgi:hypothetical protein
MFSLFAVAVFIVATYNAEPQFDTTTFDYGLDDNDNYGYDEGNIFGKDQTRFDQEEKDRTFIFA